MLSGQEREMKTSSLAVLAWSGGWTDGTPARRPCAIMRPHGADRGYGMVEVPRRNSLKLIQRKSCCRWRQGVLR